MQKNDSSRKCIGILSFPHSVSPGASLQMFALYDTVRYLGKYPVIINYYSPYMRKDRHLDYNRKSTIISAIRRIIRRVVHWRLFLRYRRFEAQMTHMPKRPFGERSYLKRISNNCQAIICGSDQVWNPTITDYDLSYFLEFCNSDIKRISYAPSFGFTDFPAKYDEEIANELRRFSSISVRDLQGYEKVKKLIGIEPSLVLDPTFLVPRSKWEAIEIPCNIHKKYILYYAVRHSEKMFQFCIQLSRRTNLPIVVVGGNFFSKHTASKEKITFMVDVAPQQWIYLISHARYIVTNSFHGLSFSIIFGKDFFLDLSSRTNARLEHLVTMLGLENRIIKKEIDYADIDYSAVDKKLESMRNSSLDYLRKALRDV